MCFCTKLRLNMIPLSYDKSGRTESYYKVSGKEKIREKISHYQK